MATHARLCLSPRHCLQRKAFSRCLNPHSSHFHDKVSPSISFGVFLPVEAGDRLAQECCHRSCSSSATALRDRSSSTIKDVLVFHHLRHRTANSRWICRQSLVLFIFLDLKPEVSRPYPLRDRMYSHPSTFSPPFSIQETTLDQFMGTPALTHISPYIGRALPDGKLRAHSSSSFSQNSLCPDHSSEIPAFRITADTPA